MMKKMVCMMVCILLIACMFPQLASASENDRTYEVDLTVDMQSECRATPGDIVTVRMYLNRTDSDADAPIYAMQNEIWYDDSFLEFVDGSSTTYSGVEIQNLARRTGGRAVYLNFLSLQGGIDWPAKVMVGSFQFRVIGTQGATRIISENVKVSTKDGQASFEIANINGAGESGASKDATVIVSSGCVVMFDSAGGSAVPDQVVQYGEKIIEPEDPIREGYYFAGWYSDFDRTQIWDFDNDAVKQNMTLYAKWSDTPVVFQPDDKTGLCLTATLLGILLFVLLIASSMKRVSFDSHGGSKVKSLYIRKGSTLNDVQNPEKDGYEFVGWYVDLNDEDAFDFDNEKIIKNMTVHAKWRKII